MRSGRIGQKIDYFHLSGKKSVALLLDPDKDSSGGILKGIAETATVYNPDFIFVGGSLVSTAKVVSCVDLAKSLTKHIPIVLFPGSAMQLAGNADAVLFLSLISGRNPDLLIGQHVLAAPSLGRSRMEVLPTGYMLVDSGEITSVNYISQTLPLPHNKPDLAVATAMAGTFLGLRYLYLDAGSGAKRPVPPKIIAAVKENIQCPLIVGGGIDTASKAKTAWESGADMIVLGNGVEKNPDLLTEVLHLAHSHNLSLNVN